MQSKEEGHDDDDAAEHGISTSHPMPLSATATTTTTHFQAATPLLQRLTSHLRNAVVAVSIERVRDEK